VICNSSDLADLQNLEVVPADIEVLKALGHPTRMRLIELLAAGEARPKDFLNQLDATSGTVSRMLAELREARLIERVGQGTWAPHRLVLPNRTNELIDLAALLGSELSDLFANRAELQARVDRQRHEERQTRRRPAR
jgi:DNA-binding transcriptional ArsR family regulator